MQPGADLLVIHGVLNGGFKFLAGDALEVKEQVIQRAIVEIFAGSPGHAGAAFVNGAADDHESGDARTRAVRGHFGQVFGDDGGIHICCFHKWKIDRV